MQSLLRRFAIPGLISVAVLVAAGGYWALKIRERTNEGTVEKAVAAAHSSATAHCSELQSNGSTWACAVIYQAESECVLAKASVFGSINQILGRDRCSKLVALRTLVPTATAPGVAADVNRIASQSDGARSCAKLQSGTSKWACAVPGELSQTCVIVRVLPWRAWTLAAGHNRCAQVPALHKVA